MQSKQSVKLYFKYFSIKHNFKYLFKMSEDIGITESDDDYEEQLVYVDLDSLFPAEELAMGDTNIKIIGMESQSPIIQINGKIFKGKYDYAIGTNLFFHEDLEKTQSTEKIFGFHPETYYKYYGKTDKILNMTRIFIQQQDTAETDNLNQEDVEEETREKCLVHKTYSDALNQLLDPGQVPPREIVLTASQTTDIIENSKKISGWSADDSAGSGEDKDDPKDEDYIPYEMDVG